MKPRRCCSRRGCRFAPVLPRARGWARTRRRAANHRQDEPFPSTRAVSEGLKVNVKSFIRSIVAFASIALLPSALVAQGALPSQEPGEPAKAKPGILGKIGIDQRLNHRLPL